LKTEIEAEKVGRADQKRLGGSQVRPDEWRPGARVLRSGAAGLKTLD
jgi:hypothetical protein